MPTDDLSKGAIERAADRLAPHIRRTPILEVDGADFGLAGVRLVFKLEFLQHAGSFKTRGAFNNLLTRDDCRPWASSRLPAATTARRSHTPR